jgi:mutator protein MutT
MSSPEKEIVVGVVQDDDDRILLIERKAKEDFGDFGELSITFPSGKVKINETPITAVVREIWEEAGCYARPNTVIYSGPHDFAGVGVTYFGCELINFSRNHKKDPAIERIFWAARTALIETVQTPINSEVLRHLNLT